MRALEPLRRIQWQLPLSIAGLLLAVVAAHSWIAYREVRRTALEAAGERLEDVGRQLGGLFAQLVTQRTAEMRAVAGDSAVIGAVARGADLQGAGSATFERLLASDSQVMAVVLWDSSGALDEVRRPEADTLPIGRSFPAWAAGDSMMVSRFLLSGEVGWYDVAAPVRQSGRTVGYVVQSRRLAMSQQGAQVLADLIGRDVTFRIGTPGVIWTDLGGFVEGPPAAAAAGEGLVEYRIEGSGWRLGEGVVIAGTPWQLWVESPRDDVLGRPRAFLTRMLLLGAFIALLGALGGWALTRRVTTGLSQLTTASASMAEGDLGRRVPVKRRDELGELAAAFNRMAERVEDAQQRLEQRVQERTAELQASQEQFSAIAATAHEAIVTADAAGTITYFNPGAERVFGYTADEVRGQPLTRLMPERYRDKHRHGFARFLETGESKVIGRTLELTGLRRDGTEFPVELSLSSWQRNGESAFAGIIRDVTQRREAEEALERSASELQAVNEELEAFSYSVSHDLRAPLRSIHGFSQALLEDYRDRLDADGRDYLERVCTAVDRMGQLIDDLLELAQATRAAMRSESVDLGAVARGIVDELRAAAPARQVRFTVADDLTVTGDARLLRLMLQNLLANAWKFTSKERQAEIEVGVGTVDGGERAFFVRDNGAGFDMTYAEKLFGAFQRLHAPSDFPGTGVGLALVQRIIHRHGGRIWAEGAEGTGATFHFTLPGS
jgi:PAS domain S-box-containing protein